MSDTPKKDPFELGFKWGTDRTTDDIEKMGDESEKTVFDSWFERRAQYIVDFIVEKEDRDAFLEGARVARKLLL